MTTELTRLPALPKEIRDGFRTDPHVSRYGRTPRPEGDRGVHGIYNLTTAEKAAVTVNDLVYYRGRAKRGGYMGGTQVFVIVVYQGHVIWSDTQQVYTDYDRKKKQTLWNTTGEVHLHVDDSDQRKRALIAGEHQVAETARKKMLELVTGAKKSIAKAKHEAKASTKLAHVRKDIARLEKELKTLRAQEKKLARQAKKEEAA